MTAPTELILTDDQQTALDAFVGFLLSPIEKVFVLEGYSGTGKEQPVSTTVQTPQGPRRFGDLKVGDFVFGVDGKPTKVTQIFPQGVKPVFHVTFRDHTTTRCGAEHLWEVHTKKATSGWKVKTTVELIKRGLTNSAGPRYRVPLCAPVEYPKQELPFDPYFIGALIGDGYLGGNTPALSNPEMDYDIVERIKTTLPEHFELTYKSINVNQCPQFYIKDNLAHNANRLKNHLKEIGLAVGSLEKHIPVQYLQSSVEDRKALLKGLMDTDGTSRGNRISFSSMSLQLAKDVQTLVQSLGGVGILHTFDRTHHNKGTEYNVNVRMPFNPFYCARKAAGWSLSTKNPPSKYIKSIVQDGEEEQMCIMVEAAEHLYLTDNFIVTHNSTLVKTLMDQLPGYIKTAKLIDPHFKELAVLLTATTNKAAEAFATITGMEVTTIHSCLGLRVSTNFSTGVTTLIPRANSQIYDSLIFIDEASYVEKQLLGLIFSQTVRCKIVFIGDRAQLKQGNATGVPPVFAAGFHGAMLEKVVRQAEDNPIITLSTQFRETVKSGVWTPFKPDGKHIIHLNQSDFEDHILAEFTRPEWRYKDSKVLGWTNKCGITYNHAISAHIKGDPHFQVGDYAINNSYVTTGKQNIKTDQLVCITCIESDTEDHEVIGNYVTVDYVGRFFFPKSLEARNQRIKQAKALGDIHIVAHIDNSWIDLRAAYAQTVNKSQGSTYDRVYLDLNDIKRCNSGDAVARMMYVAVSRAKHQVFMTGDFG